PFASSSKLISMSASCHRSFIPAMAAARAWLYGVLNGGRYVETVGGAGACSAVERGRCPVGPGRRTCRDGPCPARQPVRRLARLQSPRDRPRQAGLFGRRHGREGSPSARIPASPEGARYQQLVGVGPRRLPACPGRDEWPRLLPARAETVGARSGLL